MHLRHPTSLAAAARSTSRQQAAASTTCARPTTTTRSARHPRASAQHNQQQRPSPSASSSSSRRSVLTLGGGAAAAAAALLLLPGPRRASADIASDLERQLPGVGGYQQQQQPAELPKPYQRTMRRLARALQESIEAEAAGAKEFEVRRKADGAKELVREFVGKWQDNAAVVGDVTHREMKEAISELGRFYQAAGPRARLSEAAKSSVLQHLAAVQAALPEEEPSLLGF